MRDWTRIKDSVDASGQVKFLLYFTLINVYMVFNYYLCKRVIDLNIGMLIKNVVFE